jgi:hypothetical protein
VHERYRETAAFGEDHVWLRNDLTGGVGPTADAADAGH